MILNDEGYCEGCSANYNCHKCPYMNELSYYHNSLLYIVDIENKKEEEKREENICSCGMPIVGNGYMCRECYLRHKVNRNF